MRVLIDRRYRSTPNLKIVGVCAAGASKSKPAQMISLSMALVIALGGFAACSGGSSRSSLLKRACGGAQAALADSGGLLARLGGGASNTRDPNLDIVPAVADARKAGDIQLADAIQSVGLIAEASYRNQSPPAGVDAGALNILRQSCLLLGIDPTQATIGWASSTFIQRRAVRGGGARPQRRIRHGDLALRVRYVGRTRGDNARLSVGPNPDGGKGGFIRRCAPALQPLRVCSSGTPEGPTACRS